MADEIEKPNTPVESSTEKLARQEGAQIKTAEDNTVLTDQERQKQDSFRSNDVLKALSMDSAQLNRSFQIVDGADILVDSHAKSRDQVVAKLPADSAVEIAAKPVVPRRTDEAEAKRKLAKQHHKESVALDDYCKKAWVKEAIEKSPSFASLIKGMHSIPWAKEIRVWEGPNPAYPDYNSGLSLLEINSSERTKRKAETLAHEGYHSTHQDLATLYKTPQVSISRSQYVDVKMQQEAGAFLQEIKVNEELIRAFPNVDRQPVEFMAVDPKNPGGDPVRHVLNELVVRDERTGKINDWASMKRIQDFLSKRDGAIKEAGTNKYKREPDGTLVPNSYPKHYASGYDEYVKNYKSNRASMAQKGYINIAD